MLFLPRGRGGEIYHLTDGKPQQFKDFISLLLRTQDIDPSTIGAQFIFSGVGLTNNMPILHREHSYMGCK